MLRVVPDVCPTGDRIVFSPDFTRSNSDNAESYENVSDIKEMTSDGSMNLKNKDKPGEESICWNYRSIIFKQDFVDAVSPCH